MKSLSKIQGYLNLNVYKKKENLWIFEKNIQGRNQILNDMLAFTTNRISGNTSNTISQITFGTSTVETNRYQNIDVMENTFTKDLTAGITYPTINTVVYPFDLLPDEHSGYNITEYALTLTDGSIVTRIVRGIVEKKSDIRLTGTWELTFEII